MQDLNDYQFRIGPLTIPAGGSNLNSLEGKRGRFIDNMMSLVQVTMAGSAPGIEAEMEIGQRQVKQRSSVPPELVAGAGPDAERTPVFAAAKGYSNEEVFIRIYNPTAGNLDVIYDFEQVGLQ